MPTKNGTDQGEFIQSDAPDTTINGFGGGDALYATFGGTNFLNGGDGNDLLIGGPGLDRMDGGSGNDNTASYRFSPGAVTASLANPGQNTGEAQGDTYVNVQNLEGTKFNDTLIGDGQPVNVLNGIEGNDRLFGGFGYATMIGGPGADQHIGGAGKGLIDYETSLAGLTASLANPSINTNDAQGDTYSNLFDMAGSAFDDTLIGDGNNNNYLGNGGNDAISLGVGNDTANGGTGSDTLTGGRDADMFAFGGTYVTYDPNVNTADPLAHLVHHHPLAVIAEGKAGIFDRITDFNQGNSGTYNAGESDSLKVANLVAGNASLVRLFEDSSKTFTLLQVDIDGGGAEPWVTIARIDGLHVGEVVNVMLDDTGAVTKYTVGGDAPTPLPPSLPQVHSDAWLLSNGNWSASIDPGGHPLGSHIAGVGDFNRDGTSDLLWFNPSNMAAEVWTLANAKWAASASIGTHPAGYNIAGIGDFNGDGHGDVLWVNPTNNQTDIWNLQNGQWFASTTIGPHPMGYQFAGIGDFDRDGTSDVVWFNPSNGDVDIWMVKNGTWAGSVAPGRHPAGWEVGGVGDFNKDGFSDIFFFNAANGQTDIWLMSNGQWMASVSPGNHPTGYRVSGIGDFNNDGYSDVLWHNPVTGQIDEWKIVDGRWAGSVNLGNHSGGVAGIGDFNGDHTADVMWHF